ARRYHAACTRSSETRSAVCSRWLAWTWAASTSTTDGSIPENVPSGFDPCADITQEVLDSEGLRNKQPSSNEGSNGIKWQGCRWIQSDGYGATISVTNITVGMVRDNPDRTIRDEYAIGGREAIASHVSDEKDPKYVCTLHVAMEGGSLEFGLSNSPSRRKTGSTDTCVLARTLAEKVVPLIPAGT
ncbi:DUF3558 domain-containing protein, partial [Nocardia cyriacigeorgica]|nr:DUF3558 domain-containing protein [Nocardia cyriacigeorgica]